MHPDLAQLAIVGECDHRLASIDRAIGRKRDKAAAADADVAATEAAIAALDEQLKDVRRQDGELNAKIARYTTRRDRAMKALQTGAGDAIVAEKQLQQCNEILDDTETSLLELMEQEEELVGQRETQLATLQTRQATAADVHTAVDADVAVQQVKRERVDGQRKAAYDTLPADVVERYEELRRRRVTAVSWLEKTSCTSCQITVSMQHIADLKRGLVVPCKRCARYLVPAPKPI